jgi:hypothetical protein
MLPSLREPALPFISPFLDKRHGTERRDVEWISLGVRAHEIHVCSQREEDAARSSITSHRIVQLPGPHLFRFDSRVAANRRWSALDSASGIPGHARVLDVVHGTARGVRHHQKLRLCAIGIHVTLAVLRLVRERGTAALHKVGKTCRFPIAFPSGSSAMPRQNYWVLRNIKLPISAWTAAVTEIICSVRFATYGVFRK